MDLLRSLLRRPLPTDDKYSRGVVGFITGSETYPGAALLGINAAMRTGVGMVRYLGPASIGSMVLETHPEVVLQDGRCQAWVLGSGVVPDAVGQSEQIREVLMRENVAVVDAGALELVNVDEVQASCVLTPHAGELSRLFDRFGKKVSRAEIEGNPVSHAVEAAMLTKQVVLLKGNITTVASPDGTFAQTEPANPALATAGSGDVLAGILGALLASNRPQIDSGDLNLAQIALAAAQLHSLAADRAAMAGPMVASDLPDALRSIVGEYFA